MVNIRSLTLTVALVIIAGLGFSHSASAQGVFGNSVGFGNSFGFTFGGHSSYHAPGRYDSRMDPKLIQAANYAEHRAGNHTTWHCWQYVKDALVATGAVHSRPTSAYACQAGPELLQQGFVQIHVWDPFSAPTGAILVYAGGGAGHVEFRTAYGFVSDYKTTWKCKYHLIGVYVKMANSGHVAAL